MQARLVSGLNPQLSAVGTVHLEKLVRFKKLRLDFTEYFDLVLNCFLFSLSHGELSSIWLTLFVLLVLAILSLILPLPRHRLVDDELDLLAESVLN